jgi:hypothetical protein
VECERLLETGSTGRSAGFDLLRVPAFARAGIQAILVADLDLDGLPDLAASHRHELEGLRFLTNRAGK